MKSILRLNKVMLLFIVTVFLIPSITWCQPKRIKPPNRDSKVKSADQFVNNSFRLYHKVFVYDSLMRAGVDVPPEIEEELVERAQQDADSLLQAVPSVIDDISDASFLRQARATLNLNKAKKALKYCTDTVKGYFLPNKEEEGDN